jgi:KUP system potassium uptake protein
MAGSEAMYSALGHFGRQPIQIAWFLFVLPALALNYAEQAAMVLAIPNAVENPFYRTIPEALLLPMVVLATIATAIASQAAISAGFSVARQAVQLGLIPALRFGIRRKRCPAKYLCRRQIGF